MTGKSPWTLKQIRHAHDLKQAHFAELLSKAKHSGQDAWSSKTVSAYEADDGKPSEKYLQNVAAAFGISIDQIAVPSTKAYYPTPRNDTLSTKDEPTKTMTQQEFRDAADKFAVECHRRGHRLAARALMDLVDDLDGAGHGENRPS